MRPWACWTRTHRPMLALGVLEALSARSPPGAWREAASGESCAGCPARRQTEELTSASNWTGWPA